MLHDYNSLRVNLSPDESVSKKAVSFIALGNSSNRLLLDLSLDSKKYPIEPDKF